ncbi:MAG: hypothetical protein M3619_25610 [Myxococcota bacterium]|nr:hypothetical protein [Myxococcota bacterium]
MRDKTERRIARVSRQCAKIVIQLRELGDVEGATRFEQVAIEVVEQMRRTGARET